MLSSDIDACSLRFFMARLLCPPYKDSAMLFARWRHTLYVDIDAAYALMMPRYAAAATMMLYC